MRGDDHHLAATSGDADLQRPTTHVPLGRRLAAARQGVTGLHQRQPSRERVKLDRQ
jgi:hypothetical protein